LISQCAEILGSLPGRDGLNDKNKIYPDYGSGGLKPPAPYTPVGTLAFDDEKIIFGKYLTAFLRV
jgi:hypothetical protein